MKQAVVFDTNVLISGYLWSGSPRHAIQLVKSGEFRLLYCKESIDELVRVLSMKFALDSTEIYRILLDIKGMGRKVSISSKEHPVNDDATDNLFINLAIDGSAEIIVSGDSHLLKLKRYKGIEIVTVSEFLKR